LATQDQQIDAALRDCEGEFVAIAPADLPVNDMWVEEPLYALINNKEKNQAYQMESSSDQLWSAVFRKEELLEARKLFPNEPVRQSVLKSGITIQRVAPEEIPFQFDSLLKQGKQAGRNGNWYEAAEIFEYIAEHYQNELWMKSLVAGALHKAGDDDRAAELVKKVNASRPTVDTLLLEARIHKKSRDFSRAIELLESARSVLKGDYLYGNS
jgi:Flp pilus assembly protein TadD